MVLYALHQPNSLKKLLKLMDVFRIIDYTTLLDSVGIEHNNGAY